MSRALLNPIPDWPAMSVACVILSSVKPGKGRSRDLRETWKEPFERPLPNLVVDFCSELFLKDGVAVKPQDVVDAAIPQTLLDEGELRLRVLAELDAFVHCSDDLCLAQEPVRDVLSRPNSYSEGGAAVGDC